MSKRIVLMLCAVVALTVGVAAAAADDGNSVSAQLCQKGGWQSTAFTQSGGTFASEAQCVAYASHGGTIAAVVVSTALAHCAISPDPHVFCWGAITGHGLTPSDFTPAGNVITITILNANGSTNSVINRPVDANGNAFFGALLGCDPVHDLGQTFSVTTRTAAGATITTQSLAVPC
jgi:hypothetical protein